MRTHGLVALGERLLGRYEAPGLVAELASWERVRMRTAGPRYEPPADPNAQTILTLDGIPGAGKSTTQRWLQPALGAAYFSMARFAEARGVSADERRRHQLETGQPHPVDEAFIEALEGCDARFIVLEKFPRSVVEAVALLRSVRVCARRFEVLHLELPGDCVALSTQRQLDRGPRHGRMPEPEDARHRALVHLARATSGRETLRAHGVPIHAIDMTRPMAENERAIRHALGLHPEALQWPWRQLEVLERAARRVGADAWVGSGTVYRPFWNERFGPAQWPTDQDVAVEDARAVTPLLAALEAAAPDVRWSVMSPAARLRERHGIEATSAFEAKRFTTFQHRGGLVRLWEGGLELHLPEGTEACLRNGIVALNSRLLDALEAPQRAQVLARTHHLTRALEDYPGLRVDPRSAALLAGGQRGLDHPPQRIVARWAQLKALTADAQRGQFRDARTFCRRALGSEERRIALDILRFHRDAERHALPPPIPPRSPTPRVHPAQLGEVMREADDLEFGDWFLDQVHHHQPRGGAEPYLRSVMEGSIWRGVLRNQERAQSAMHQGWTLERHLAQSVLQLRTDALMERLVERHGSTWSFDLRMCMRMAMLFHDTGKLLGRRPRRHAIISAALFGRCKPAWFPANLVPLTQWCIRTHDVFGAFSRGVTDKDGVAPGRYEGDLELATSYFGALDSQAARAALLAAGLPLEDAVAINKALWCADIGSIATLRWLLPVAELVERLLLSPVANREPAARR